MVNAAKYAGADAVVVSVYAEVEPATRSRSSSATGARASTWTRSPEDRMGVRESIIGRMERHGGKARVRTAPGEGTEVRLEMRRDRNATMTA